MEFILLVLYAESEDAPVSSHRSQSKTANPVIQELRETPNPNENQPYITHKKHLIFLYWETNDEETK